MSATVATVAIDVTLVRLRAPAATVARACTLLDDRERAAAAGRNRDARRRSVLTHAAVRLVIATRLGVDPHAVAIGVEPGGRPVADGIAFNLSHSGERAAIAVAAPGARIGVDIERVRARRFLDALAHRVFDAAAYERWAALPAPRRPRAFASRWTEVEAVLKGRGTGIAAGLASAIDPPGWVCAPVEVGRGYVGTVAAEGASIVVTAHELDLAARLATVAS